MTRLLIIGIAALLVFAGLGAGLYFFVPAGLLPIGKSASTALHDSGPPAPSWEELNLLADQLVTCRDNLPAYIDFSDLDPAFQAYAQMPPAVAIYDQRQGEEATDAKADGKHGAKGHNEIKAEHGEDHEAADKKKHGSDDHDYPDDGYSSDKEGRKQASEELEPPPGLTHAEASALFHRGVMRSATGKLVPLALTQPEAMESYRNDCEDAALAFEEGVAALEKRASRDVAPKPEETSGMSVENSHDSGH